MVYECQFCEYKTNRKSNFIRHKNRKYGCCNTKNDVTSSQKEDDTNSHDPLPNVTNSLHLVVPNVTNMKDKLQCDKCKKQLCDKKSYEYHIKICKGVDSKTCPICFKMFQSAQGKYQHSKNVKCIRPPTSVILQAPCAEYIYLLQTRECFNNNEAIYKVGRTVKEKLTRFNQYPKGSKILLHMICDNSEEKEKSIIEQFNRCFKNEEIYGKEYFNGDFREMISIILKETLLTFNCTVNIDIK